MKKENNTVPPLQLDSGRFWDDIETLEKNGEIPAELGTMLRTLIITFFEKAVTPEAKPHLLDLVRKHLPGGIEFTDRGTKFDIVHFVPEDVEEGRPFFYFAQQFPGGRFYYVVDEP